MTHAFTFDPDTHIGRMNGVVWPSVTQLLQESKLIDYSGVPRDVLENKRILGTRVHYCTNLIDECDFDEDDAKEKYPEILPYLEAYRKFRVIEKFEPGQRVGRMVSLKLKFHGEMDEHGIRLERHGQDLYIIDYKCTFEMYPSTGPQDAAYGILLNETRGIRIARRYGLQLKANGNYELIEYKDPNDKKDFLACLWLHWQRREKYKTVKEIAI